eukprot:7630437-Ditylum_brightwellii.AAC.1
MSSCVLPGKHSGPGHMVSKLSWGKVFAMLSNIFVLKLMGTDFDNKLIQSACHQYLDEQNIWVAAAP